MTEETSIKDKEPLVWKRSELYPTVEASKEGELRNTITKSILKQHITNKGYKRIALPAIPANNDKASAHRIIALAWVPNPDNLPQVNHIDGNKTNNHVDNLEWMSGSDNVKHAFNNNLRFDNIGIVVKNIIDGTKQEYISINSARKPLGLTQMGILTYICRSKVYPLYGKYEIYLQPGGHERIVRNADKEPISLYVYDHVTHTTTGYSTLSMLAYSIGINVTKLPYDRVITQGGYTISKKEKFIIPELTAKQALIERDKLCSRQPVRMYNGFELYDYATKEIHTFKDRNAVAKFAGCSPEAVTGSILRGMRVNRTWLLGGYGIRTVGNQTDWYIPSESELINSKLYNKISINVYEVNGKQVYGNTELGKILGKTTYSINEVIRGIKEPRIKIDKLSDDNVTVIKI